MKKFIRLLIKLPATPFVFAFFAFSYIIFSIMSVFEWIYESSEFDKSITREIKSDIVKSLKTWCTTI